MNQTKSTLVVSQLMAAYSTGKKLSRVLYLALLLVVLFSMSALAQNQDLTARINQIEIGRSTLQDLERIFGEPAKFAWGRRTFTRANLPDPYIANYDGFAFFVGGGAVQEIRIEAPSYRCEGGIHAGSPIADIIKAFGEPRAIVKGPAPAGERRTGVLYEGTAEQPGSYTRRDLGLMLFLKEGKVAAIVLSRQVGGKLKELPRFDPKSRDPFQMDLRGADLSGLDLRNRAADLRQATFDTRTVWPAKDMMPEEFNPRSVLEMAQNPGLGVRSLHKRGITGRGIGIAIVDNPLLDSHREFASRIRVHEYINARKDGEPHFHGSAVTSFAAGETAGVAAEADIYYISSWAFSNRKRDHLPRAKAFDRILEINRTLPPDKKIRVISMSLGWTLNDAGGAEMEAAANRARDAGMLVLTPSIKQTHGFEFDGLGREPLADPDSFESYGPGEFWAARFFDGAAPGGRLLVPMDSRTAAGPGSNEEYTYFRRGGLSWSVPYLAGMYALAVQVNPKITPESFWEIAMKTGRIVQIKRGDRSFALGPILDPVALIAVLEKR